MVKKGRDKIEERESECSSHFNRVEREREKNRMKSIDIPLLRKHSIILYYL